jgi:hypothetical protein
MLSLRHTFCVKYFNTGASISWGRPTHTKRTYIYIFYTPVSLYCWQHFPLLKLFITDEEVVGWTTPSTNELILSWVTHTFHSLLPNRCDTLQTYKNTSSQNPDIKTKALSPLVWINCSVYYKYLTHCFKTAWTPFAIISETKRLWNLNFILFYIFFVTIHKYFACLRNSKANVNIRCSKFETNTIDIDSAWLWLIMGSFINDADLQNDIGNCSIVVRILFQNSPLSPYLCAEEVPTSLPDTVIMSNALQRGDWELCALEDGSCHIN